MTPRLLVDHHRVPRLNGIEESVVILDLFRRSSDQARYETLSEQTLRCIAPIRVETESDHRNAISSLVGDDRSDARRHRAEVDVGVADRRTDRHDVLTNFEDFQATLLAVASIELPACSAPVCSAPVSGTSNPTASRSDRRTTWRSALRYRATAAREPSVTQRYASATTTARPITSPRSSARRATPTSSIE
jgi:hypothetical protein